jgi:hypothetical protein
MGNLGIGSGSQSQTTPSSQPQHAAQTGYNTSKEWFFVDAATGQPTPEMRALAKAMFLALNEGNPSAG